MKITLDELKPILEEKSKECEVMLQQLDKEQVEVEEVTKIVEQQSEEVLKEKNEAEVIQEECKLKLDEATPLLEEAIKAL